MIKAFTFFMLLFFGSAILSREAAAQQTTETKDTTVKQLKNVIITSKKPLIVHKSDKTIINVEGSILGSGNTAMEILARAPGVSIDNEGNISLKGKRGVSVMIDGKLTYLSAAQLANLLRSTSGNTIESIELINNPSAKYDAAGSAGLINIKLKKNTSYGTNGSINAGFGYGYNYKSNFGLTANHRSTKLNLFGNFNYDRLKESESLSVRRSNTSGAAVTYFNVAGQDLIWRSNGNYKAGLDYSFNKKSIIGFMATGYLNHTGINAVSTTKIGSIALITDSIIQSVNPYKSKFNNQNYNLNFKSILDSLGEEISADIDYSNFNSMSRISNSNYFLDLQGKEYKTPLIFRTESPANIHIWAAKVDFSYPFSPKSKLETGIKSSFVKTDNDYQFEDLLAAGWENNPIRSNRFIYKEYINAAYLNYSKSFKTTSIQLGLRAEQTRSEGNSITAQNLVRRSYLDFFPSISLNQTLGGEHEIGISYNKRIDRPDYQSLNPFIIFTDLYTLQEGNPLLNPQYTNSFNISYAYKKKFSLGIGYSHTNNVITSIFFTDSNKKTLTLSEQNLALQKLYDLNISSPVTFTKWWESNNELNVFYRNFSSPDMMGVPFNSRKLSYAFNTVQTFTIRTTFSAELGFNYQSPQVYGTYLARPIYSTNVGISKSFAAQRATIKLAINDLFNTQKIRIRSTVVNQDYLLMQKAESRIFRLGFSYNFGSNKIMAVRERSNGASGEQQRVKSGN
jgi:hypothetical protein